MKAYRKSSRWYQGLVQATILSTVIASDNNVYFMITFDTISGSSHVLVPLATFFPKQQDVLDHEVHVMDLFDMVTKRWS